MPTKPGPYLSSAAFLRTDTVFLGGYMSNGNLSVATARYRSSSLNYNPILSVGYVSGSSHIAALNPRTESFLDLVLDQGSSTRWFSFDSGGYTKAVDAYFRYDLPRYREQEVLREYRFYSDRGYSYGAYTKTVTKNVYSSYTEAGTRTVRTSTNKVSTSIVATGWHDNLGNQPSEVYIPSNIGMPVMPDPNSFLYTPTVHEITTNLDSLADSINESLKIDIPPVVIPPIVINF